jgi:sulfur carrier protein
MNFEDGITVREMLEKLELDIQKVVVEVDLKIINKDEFSTKKLRTESKVEIIRFVGGG